MTLTIELTGEMEQRLHEQAAALGCDVRSFVERFLTENLSTDVSAVAPPRRRSPAEFRAQLEAIAHRHPGSTGLVDDSRESIYAGRGE